MEDMLTIHRHEVYKTEKYYQTDFNGISTCLELLYAYRLRNCVHLYLHFLVVLYVFKTQL